MTKRFNRNSKSELIRLNKFIANSGICNRREADAFIANGLVKVNGKVVTALGMKVFQTDKVELEDKVVVPGKKIFVLLNKPKNFSCNRKSEKSILDIVKNAFEKESFVLNPLAEEERGLIIITNDSELLDQSKQFNTKLKALYKVELEEPLRQMDFEKLNKLQIPTFVIDKIAYTNETKKIVGIELPLIFGDHIVTQFQELNYKVTYLDRVLIGDLSKRNLARGQWRFLDENEIKRIKNTTYSKKEND